MTYFAVNPVDATRFIDEFVDNPLVLLDYAERSDDLTDQSAQEAFILSVNNSYAKASKRLLTKKAAHDNFEVDVSDALADLSNQISPEAVFDHGFWLYLSCMTIDAHKWRYPDWELDSLKGNMGIKRGGFAESLFGRLLIRLNITAGTEELKGFVTQDFWRSHIMRTGYGRNPELARAFSQLVQDRNLNTRVTRKMAKVLQKRHANLLLDIFSAEDSSKILLDALNEASD